MGQPIISAIGVLLVVASAGLLATLLWRTGLGSVLALLQDALSWLDDRITLNLSYLVGTRTRTRWLRWSNLTLYFALVLAGVAYAPAAVAFFVAIVFGFGGVWAVFEHWSWDEAERFENVPAELKRIATTESLIAEMLVAIACVPTIATVALERLQGEFSIYELAPGSGTFAFARLTLSELIKAIPIIDYYEMYEQLLHFEDVVGVVPANVWGMTATFALRIAYDVITIAGLIKLIDIRRRISRGEDLRELDKVLRSADSTIQLASVAKLRQFALRGAAAARRRLGDIILQRVERVPVRFSADVRFEAADALREVGGTRIDRGALLESIRALRALATEVDKATAEEFWARIEDSLGVGLRVLGEFLQGDDAIAALKESITAFDLAIEVRTREKRPAEFARSQNNLGVVLTTLGERLIGAEAIEYLRRSVASFRSALEIFTRAAYELDWAKTQSNLGIALSSLSARLSEGNERTQTLRDSVSAFEASLAIFTTASLVSLRALALSGMATAQRMLAEGLDDSEALPLLRSSVAAFREAIKLRPLSEFPLTWAIAQNGLGNAYRVLGGRLRGNKALRELRYAVAAYASAQVVYQRDQFPLQWAMTESNLGDTYVAMSKELKRTPAKVDALEQAIEHLRAALEVFDAASEPYYAGDTRARLDAAEATLAALSIAA